MVTLQALKSYNQIKLWRAREALGLAQTNGYILQVGHFLSFLILSLKIKKEVKRERKEKEKNRRWGKKIKGNKIT